MSPKARRQRVVLRPLTESDVQAAASWHESVGRGLSLDRGRAGALPYRSGSLGEEARSDPPGGLLAITRCEDDVPIGVMEYRVGVPEDGWLAFRLVAVEPRLRGLGLDSEAVRLVEDDAHERGLAGRFWARVQHSDGLGLYFWLRLGYRPARLDEDDSPREHGDDTIVMTRVPAM